MKEQIKKYFIYKYTTIKTYILKNLNKITNLIKSTSNNLVMMDIEDNVARYSLNWWFRKSFKWVTALLFAIITLFLWGCSGVSITKYYPVSVPVVCSVDAPLKPEYSEDIVITNINILAYAEKLQAALNVCKNGGLDD